ncbi:hypothetical protein Ccrd_020985, partial [Cynara cardunculus var. scolymus]
DWFISVSISVGDLFAQVQKKQPWADPKTVKAEFRSNGLRRQPVAMIKDRDLLKDNGGESDMLEENIQKLPGRGEGWDKKTKGKRSVGTVFTRPMDSNGEQKTIVQNKVVSEHGLLLLIDEDKHKANATEELEQQPSPKKMITTNGSVVSESNDKSMVQGKVGESEANTSFKL